VDDPLINTILAGRFHIKGTIGQGGFGKVYEATHDVLGGRRAIKVLRAELVHNEALVERFFREAKALYRLKASQIVKLEAYGTLDDGRPYMVLELAEGERLDRELRYQGPMAPLRVIRITRELLLGLHEAHEHGILHRDLKAENVMVQSDPAIGERIKILDLGVARILGVGRRLTQASRTVGTPEYMSPEQWQGAEDIDGRTDLFAVGVLMYEMLTGDVPHSRETDGAAAIYDKLMDERPVPISRRRDDLPPGLEGFIFRLMALERASRPVDAMAALEELERIRSRMS
jgi:serine/threonine-protein kinase